MELLGFFLDPTDGYGVKYSEFGSTGGFGRYLLAMFIFLRAITRKQVPLYNGKANIQTQA
jgi:hypothetical protein